AFVSGNFQYAYGVDLLGNLGPSAVFVVPAEGGDAIQLTDRRFLHMSPTWSPDSRSLFLVSTRDGGRDVYRIPVAPGGDADGEMERITTGLNAGTIGLAPDGRHLAYAVFTNTSNIWRVRIPQTGGASVRQAEPITRGTQHIEGLGLSRDGQWLAFDSDRSGNVDVYKMRLPNGEPIQLTTDPRDDFIPAWSADGEWIAFHSWRNGNRDVFVMSAAGGSEQQVTDDPGHDAYPDWSPDGRRLAFWAIREEAQTPSIYVAERSAGGWSAPQRLTDAPATLAKWSPDGTRVAYIAAGDLRMRDVGGLRVDTIARTGFRLGDIPYAPQFEAWSPDGQTMYFNALSRDGVRAYFAVPATGGTPRPLVRFDDPTRPSGRPEFATDGTYLYFTIDNRQADIWVMSVEGLGR
ncbi:MAG: PD40 domain-containing protein, partial [Gemmatimonadetes bacterium]|nr:PD40 domain-containing protein [Gemmatimonadota bacterium]